MEIHVFRVRIAVDAIIWTIFGNGVVYHSATNASRDFAIRNWTHQHGVVSRIVRHGCTLTPAQAAAEIADLIPESEAPDEAA